LKVLNDPEFAETKAGFARAMKMPDGRVVGVDATQDEADRALARKVVAHVNALVRSADPEKGPVLRDVVNEMLEREAAPRLPTLNAVAHDALPAATYGPDLVPVVGFRNVLSRGMNVMGRMMDVLARQPNALHAYITARRELAPWVEQLQGAGQNAEELLSNLAAHRAMNALKPFVHSPELRSQFEVLHRTAAPFLFAQDQFIKRWLRTFADSPDAIRKAQLMMNGLRTSGVIHRDANGNDFFYYPGSGTATTLIAHVLNTLHVPAALPIGVPFTGEVKYVMPGLANPLTPSVGPFVSVPMKAITQMFPEFEGTEQALLQQGASQTYWQQILPTTLSRVINTVISNPNTPGEFASMAMKAIQEAEATGHGLPPNPTPAETTAYLNRIANWTRINFFMKAVLGFFAPASPSEQFDPKHLDARLQTLMNELPYNTAITEFLREHPDATPYTVFMSSSAGGGQLPASQAAGDWLNANGQFVRDHPQASGWFIPRTTGNQPFDPSVYREQIQYGLRIQKTPAQFLDDVTMAPAAQAYYKSYDAKKQALQQAGNDTALKQGIRTTYDQWQATFLAQNRTFADYLTSGASGPRRAQTIRDLFAALDDPNLPKSPQTEDVRGILTTFDNYEQSYLESAGNYSYTASQQRSALLDSFIAWGTQQAQQNPDIADLWNLVIRPQATAVAGGYVVGGVVGVVLEYEV